MCLEENCSDSPSNEYSRHYSAESESEYLRRQNVNSKLGKEQKKKKVITSVEFRQIRIKSKKKVKMIMVQYSAEHQLILGRVRVMPYYSDSTRHIPSLNYGQKQIAKLNGRVDRELRN